jgi:hypothetical protein
MRFVIAAASMVSPCFQLNETRELTLRIEEEGRWLRKLPTPALSGSGSRVSSQPHSVEHPCFNIQIETLPARICKYANRAGWFSGEIDYE